MMEHLPISTGTDSQAARIREAVEPLVELADELHAWEQETLTAARRQFEIEDADDRLLSWLSLPADTFMNRISKLSAASRAGPSRNDAIAGFQRTARAWQLAQLSRQIELERRLASLVEDACGLTSEERELLRATRPVRDPVEVLEAKIRGSALRPAASEDENGEV
jgi:hypothetical protein